MLTAIIIIVKIILSWLCINYGLWALAILKIFGVEDHVGHLDKNLTDSLVRILIRIVLSTVYYTDS